MELPGAPAPLSRSDAYCSRPSSARKAWTSSACSSKRSVFRSSQAISALGAAGGVGVAAARSLRRGGKKRREPLGSTSGVRGVTTSFSAH